MNIDIASIDMVSEVNMVGAPLPLPLTACVPRLQYITSGLVVTVQRV